MFIVFFRTIIIYFIIIICLRIMGKRQLGELQPSEFVIAILISNIATLSIEDTDVPLLGAIVPIITLMSSEVILSYITLKNKKVQKMVTGNPVVVIRDGKIDQKSMRNLRFSIDDLMSQLRINGVFDIREVSWAIVETNGQLTVYQKFASRPLTPDAIFSPSPNECDTPPMVIISDGTVLEKSLKNCNLTKKWLDNVLEENKIAIKDIFLMTSDPTAKYYIVKKEDDNL